MVAVGKAVATAKGAAGDQFRFVVPCFTSIDEGRIRERLERNEFFWLDLTAPGQDDLERLGVLLELHPLAIRAVERVGERPKLVSYGDYVFFIFYGAWRAPAGDSSPLYEVDLFISGKYLITIHSSELPPLAKQRDELAGRALHSEQFLIYRVLDALTDSFFPILSDMENDIDDLEAAVLTHPTERQLERVFALKRQLVAMNKVVTPQRDVFARSIDELGEIPGLVLDERDYFHAVYDHLILIGELIDSCRDLLSSVTDLYLSTTSNRQNDVMKQLTLVATIFLPLAFITGFFGQNFDWMVSAVHRGWAFWAFGIGSLILTCVGLLAFFRRKGWM